MRWLVVAALFVWTAPAQTVERYEYDPSGNRTPGVTTVISGNARMERRSSINGRQVPVEKIEERIVRADGAERVVERMIQRFDPDGRPAARMRVLVEEKKLGDGGSSVRTSVYQSNASGGSDLVERSLARTTRAGDASTSETVIERMSVDGSLAPAERRTTVERGTEGSGSKNTVVYRADTNGRFVEAIRETSERQGSGAETAESSARYEPDATGRMRLVEAVERKTVKRADGSEATTVDIYAPATPGLANEDSGPKIREQQIIERRPGQVGVVETLSIRRPGLADPGRLGPARKVSEAVCSGKCP